MEGDGVVLGDEGGILPLEFFLDVLGFIQELSNIANSAGMPCFLSSFSVIIFV